MWGGPEVTEAHFFAHHHFNTSLQKRWEHAVRRFAERLQGREYHLYAGVSVERYGQRNLLKSYNARLELVHGYSGNVTRLAEVDAGQSFTGEQLRALVEGKIAQGQHGGDFLIQHKGKQAKIRLDRMILLPNPEAYGPTSRAEALVRGMQTSKEAAKDTPSPGRVVTPTPLAQTPAAVRQKTGPALTRNAVENRALDNRGTTNPSRGTAVATPPAQGEIQVVKPPAHHAPPRPVTVRPSGSDILKLPASSAMAGQMNTQSALAGGAIALYSRQLKNMRDAAEAEAERAVTRQAGVIDRYRAQGEYVLVQVTYAVPITQDVFGMEPDSYPIFWRTTVTHARLIIHTPVGSMSPEWSEGQLMKSLRNMAENVHYQPEGSRSKAIRDRKVPPGRKLVTEDYKIFEPYPPAHVKPTEVRRGVIDRCTK
jgi:hypothetical protein